MKTCSRKCKGCKGPYKLGIINKEKSKQKAEHGSRWPSWNSGENFWFSFFYKPIRLKTC